MDRRVAHDALADEGIDALTGVMRRGVGLAAIERELARAERSGEPLVLAFVDTVALKRTNDSKGHGEGDRMLREVADALTGDLRSYDVVVRVGGDEFVCALSDETVENARERYVQMSEKLTGRGSGTAITVGLAQYRVGESLQVLMDRADREMIASRR